MAHKLYIGDEHVRLANISRNKLPGLNTDNLDIHRIYLDDINEIAAFFTVCTAY